MSLEDEGEKTPEEGLTEDQELDAILGDPRKKEALIRKMGLGTEDARDSSRNLTSSGKSTGCWPTYPPGPCWPTFFPPFPYPGPGVPVPNWGEGRGTERGWSSREDGAGPSALRTEDEDFVDLLDEEEALELVEFDPKVDAKDTWPPPKSMKTFLEKHFNKSLSEEEREAILKDFPKPDTKAVSTPKLDEQVKEQLKKRGKDPHFGAEKSLFKIQEQLLETTGPLTCLWADLLNKEAKISHEDTLLLIQRALVLLGNASHAITLERRKVAWSRINPKLKSLATEEYQERDANLFGPGFLEKASKRMEVDKTLEKVTKQGRPLSVQPSKRPRYENDKGDLRRFLSRGASARCGSSRDRQSHPHTSYTRFQSKRYFQGEQGSKPNRIFSANKKPGQKEKSEQ